MSNAGRSNRPLLPDCSIFSPAYRKSRLRVPEASAARSIAGFSSNSFRSPLFIDGDRFRGRNTLQLNWFAPEEIERVEVIRGPASVVFGSEALTELVNVITRSPTGNPNGPFRFTGGGFSVGVGSAAKSASTYEWAQGAGGGFDFLGGFAGRWGGNYQSSLGEVPNSDYNSLGGSLKIGYTPDLGQRFELTLRKYSETDGRAGGVGGAPGAPFIIQRNDPNNVMSARLAYVGELDGLVKHVEASMYANYFDTTLTTVTNTINANNVATRTVTSNSHVIGPLVIGGRVLGAIPWSGGFGEAKTTFGADTFKEDRPGSWAVSQTVNRNPVTAAVTTVTNSPLAKSGPNTTQTNVGAFVLHEWTPVQPLTLSAGGRFDWYNTTTDLSPIAPAVLPAFIGKTDVDRTRVDEQRGRASTASFQRLIFWRLSPRRSDSRQIRNCSVRVQPAFQIPIWCRKPASPLKAGSGFMVRCDVEGDGVQQQI